MATGFVQRFKGKVKAQTLYLGSGGIVCLSTATGSTVTITPTEIATLDGSGLAAVTATTGSSVTPIAASGVSIIPPTTFASTYYLADPLPGIIKTFVSLTTVASSGVRTVAAITVGTVIVGSTIGNADTLNFGSSATQQTVSLIGMSTSKWAILGGAYNASTLAASTQLGPTLSTRA